MIKSKEISSILLFSILVIFLTGGITRKASAQDEQKKKKTVYLKVIEDKDGKQKVLDTVMKVDENFDEQAFLKKEGFERQREEAEKKMEKVHKMIITLDDSIISLDMDSLRDHLALIPGQMKDLQLKIYQDEGDDEGFPGFEWNGKLPCPPEVPLPPDLDDLSRLMDLIPFNKIRKFEVKQKKGYKRITLEIDDGAVFDMPHPPKVIIMEKKMHRDGRPAGKL